MKLLIIFLLFFISSTVLSEPLPQKKYLDMHVHGLCISPKNGCFYPTEKEKTIRYKMYLNAFDITIKELKQKMEMSSL